MQRMTVMSTSALFPATAAISKASALTVKSSADYSSSSSDTNLSSQVKSLRKLLNEIAEKIKEENCSIDTEETKQKKIKLLQDQAAQIEGQILQLEQRSDKSLKTRQTKTAASPTMNKYA